MSKKRKKFDSSDPLWSQMPEFNQEDQGPYFSINIHFRNEDDINAFFELIEQKRTKRKSYWYPEAKPRQVADKIYLDTK